MTTRLVVLAACFAPFVVSCGSPSAPEPDTNVLGSWGSAISWRWNDTYDQNTSRSSACEGSIDVTEQDGASFRGRYAISCSGGGGSAGAVVGGRVDRNGKLAFQLRVEEGFEPGLLPGWFRPPCQLASDAGSYTGSVANGSLDVSRVQGFDCPAAGRVVLTAAFRGARQ